MKQLLLATVSFATSGLKVREVVEERSELSMKSPTRHTPEDRES